MVDTKAYLKKDFIISISNIFCMHLVLMHKALFVMHLLCLLIIFIGVFQLNALILKKSMQTTSLQHNLLRKQSTITSNMCKVNAGRQGSVYQGLRFTAYLFNK